MAGERLDDLERRLRELEARVAGLSAEQETLRDTVVDVGGQFGASDPAEPSQTSKNAPEATTGDAASWTDPAFRDEAARTPDDRSGSDEAADGSDAATAERDIVMAPPKGASQAAVEQAVDEVERARDREENLVT
jgi:hypothetical protein